MTPYDRYMEQVLHARKARYSEEAIIAELMRERSSITSRCTIKRASLAMERTPYKAREAARLAGECLDAIDRIVKELDKKEIKV